MQCAGDSGASMGDGAASAAPFVSGTLQALEMRHICNTDADTKVANLRHSMSLGLPVLSDELRATEPAVICCGGHSLARDIAIVADLQAAGAAVFAVKGTWRLLERHGIRPRYAVIQDSSPRQAEYLRGAPDGITWLLASTCDPAVFAAAQGRDAMVWHAADCAEVMAVMEEIARPGVAIVGGPSIGSRTICLARAMGHISRHVFGLDLSWPSSSAESHVYALADGARPPIRVLLGDRSFLTTVEMASEFKWLHGAIASGQMGAITLYGDGMLTHAMSLPPASNS